MIAFSILQGGERVGARGSVYMRSVVRVGCADETTFVRAKRWARYRDGGPSEPTRLTGRGVAGPPQRSGGMAWADKWPSSARILRMIEEETGRDGS